MYVISEAKVQKSQQFWENKGLSRQRRRRKIYRKENKIKDQKNEKICKEKKLK